MMKKKMHYTVILLILFFKGMQTFGQAPSSHADKPVIDTNTFRNWPRHLQPKISDDGKYSLYTVSDKNGATLHIVANLSDWKIVVAHVHPHTFDFSNDSRQAYFINDNDSLGTFSLKSASVNYVPGIASYKIAENGNWIAWLSNGSKQLTLKNPATGKTTFYPGIIGYSFSKDGKVLVMQSANEKNNGFPAALIWVDLGTGKSTEIWKGQTAGQVMFDDQCSKLAFIATEKKDNGTSNAIYCYTKGMNAVELLADNASAGLNNEFLIANGQLIFSKQGDKLLFQIDLKAAPQVIQKKKDTHVNIWGYKDVTVQSEQLSPDFENRLKTKFWAAANLDNKKISRLNNEGENIAVPKTFETYVLVVTRAPYIAYFNEEYRPSLYLVSTVDGDRKEVIKKKEFFDFYSYLLSPDEQYILWFNRDSLNYFSYEIATGLTRNITGNVPEQLYTEVDDHRHYIFDYAGWGGLDHSVYVYGKWDLWKIDLQEKEAPVNITHGLGKQENIVFTIVDSHQRPKQYNTFIQPHGELLLSGFDPKTKYNGFWKISTGENKMPEKLNMAPYYYIGARRSFGSDVPQGGNPVKANYANGYLVSRETASSFPNWYFTRDFKTYKPIGDVHPEEKYNWLTDELVNWQMADGRMSQGILYKPENFDPKKKYPVIFDYYAKRSDELNGFIEPDWSEARINIPYYVSNGYLVFVPDIYFTKGHNGQSAVNSVVSAAKFLSKLPYIDSTKMGLQGHSFGGFETNYLVTHSNIFAAACSAAGVSDVVSQYDQTRADVNQEYEEEASNGAPYGIGVTPWTRPDLYIGDSPIFSVVQITTPLLIMHGDEDANVPYAQALEMYYAMRRAGKKVWLLQYENATHILSGNDAKDYTIRMKQFFDYYLKGALPPVWMTRGISAKLKGIDDGLEYDTSGAKP
jgi:dienelactone hydrolase